MKINRVTLKNFRSHRHTVIDFERVSFIRGLNRSGKSGIAMAIEMALAGRCAVTDEAGKGFEQLIQEGVQRAATVVLDTNLATITLTMDRNVGRTLKVEAPRGPVLMGKHAQEWIANHVGTPDVINATMNAWRFMDLSDNEQASLLARVLLPATLELEPEVNAWLADNHLSVVKRPSLFTTIEATHKAIAAARTDVNRKLRDLKAIVEPEPITGSKEKVKQSVEAIQQEQASVNDTLRSRAKAEGIAARAAEQRVTIEQAMSAIQASLPELRALLLSPEVRKATETRCSARQRLPELRLKIGAERDALQQILADLQHDHDGVCPTCQKMLSETDRDTLFAPIRAREECVRAVIAQLEQDIAVATADEAAAAELALDNAKRQKVRDAEASLHHYQEQLDALSSKSNAPDAAEPTTEVLKARLEELKQTLSTQMDALVAIATLEEQHNAYRKQLATRAHAEQQVVELEKLLEYFGPRGIKAKLIDERLSLFTARVNDALGQWGYSLDFSIEPYSLRLTEEGGPALVPNQLSASEKYRLGVAVGMAIANWTGLRFLIADGADILDIGDKWSLAQMLLASDLEQAVVTSTGIAGTFEAAGTAFFTLHKAAGITATETDAVTPQEMVAQ